MRFTNTCDTDYLFFFVLHTKAERDCHSCISSHSSYSFILTFIHSFVHSHLSSFRFSSLPPCSKPCSTAPTSYRTSYSHTSFLSIHRFRSTGPLQLHYTTNKAAIDLPSFCQCPFPSAPNLFPPTNTAQKRFSCLLTAFSFFLFAPATKISYRLFFLLLDLSIYTLSLNWPHIEPTLDLDNLPLP